MKTNKKNTYADGKIIDGVIIVDAYKQFDDNPLFYIWSEYPTYKKLDKRGYLLFNYEFYTDKNKNKYLVVSDFEVLKESEIRKLLGRAKWYIARNVDEFVEGADKEDYKRWLELIS